MAIGSISNGEAGSAVRTKLNSAITQLNGLGTASTTAATAYDAAGTAATAVSGHTTAIDHTPISTAVQPGDDAADLGSGAATDGYVLTADGSGGSAWEASAGGGGGTWGTITGTIADQVAIDLTPANIGAQPYDADTAKLDTAQTWTATQSFSLFGANAGTLTADAPFTLSQTWNNAAVAFTGLKVDVTNTASAAGSSAFKINVGGTTKTEILADGKLKTYWGYYGTQALLTGIDVYGYLTFRNKGDIIAKVPSYDEFRITSQCGIGWSSSWDGGYSSDTFLIRGEAAGTLDLRGYAGYITQSQKFRIYNTYTSATNYERAEFAWESNRFHIKTTAGTGTDRGITIDAADLVLSSLPTTDPAVAGRIWLDGTALKVSAGS